MQFSRAQWHLHIPPPSSLSSFSGVSAKVGSSASACRHAVYMYKGNHHWNEGSVSHLVMSLGELYVHVSRTPLHETQARSSKQDYTLSGAPWMVGITLSQQNIITYPGQYQNIIIDLTAIVGVYLMILALIDTLYCILSRCSLSLSSHDINMTREIRALLLSLKCSNCISEQLYNWLCCSAGHILLLYALPLKSVNQYPFRPIVSRIFTHIPTFQTPC